MKQNYIIEVNVDDTAFFTIHNNGKIYDYEITIREIATLDSVELKNENENRPYKEKVKLFASEEEALKAFPDIIKKVLKKYKDANIQIHSLKAVIDTFCTN